MSTELEQLVTERRKLIYQASLGSHEAEKRLDEIEIEYAEYLEKLQEHSDE